MNINSCLPIYPYPLIENECDMTDSNENHRKKRSVLDDIGGVATDVASGVAGVATDVKKIFKKIPEPLIEFRTSLIPIYGTYKEFKQGNIGWGIFSAATDVFVIVPVIGGGGKVVKAMLKGEKIAIKLAASDLAKSAARAVDPGIELLYDASRGISNLVTGAKVSSETLRSPLIIKDIQAFKNCPNPPLAIRNARKPVWYDHVLNGFHKVGADSSIRANHVEAEFRRLDRIIPENEKIYILTGTHGDRFGSNWVEKNTSNGNRVFEINPQYIEEKFMTRDATRDLQDYIDIGRLELIDISHPQFKFEDYIKYIEGEYHIILAYCYGRNDKAFRVYLDLPPVTSYVRTL